MNEAKTYYNEILRLRHERDRLRYALKEAISEIQCCTHPELMSDSKWKKHKLWLDSLKEALQEAGDD